MLSFALCALMSVVHAQMVHPGGWHTQADLTQIRTKVAAGEEPWKSAWEAYRNQYANADYRSNEGYLVTNNGSMANAGQNAHILAIKWVASGDQSYADAAIAVIDHWVENVREFDVYGPTLTLSTGAGSMAQAAEILEHAFNGESGWPKSSADAARAWMKKYVYDAYTNTGDQRSSNRDQPHVQGGIAHLTEAALCAWNQGVDLVTIENNRIRQGVEYHAKWNLGYDDLPFNTHIPNPCGIWNPGQDEGISDSERGLLSPVYYMSAKLFTLAGLDHPYTQEVLTSNGYSPEVSNTAHPGLGSLAFIPLPTDGSIEIEEPVQPVVTITSDFTPDPNKKYYIDVPVHNLRIGSTGNSEDPFTTSTNTTGADVEWKFTSNESGAWHIDRADGGSLPRLRTDATESASRRSSKITSKFRRRCKYGATYL